MTDQELKDLVASLALQSAKTDEELKALVAQSAKTDAQIAKTDEDLKALVAQSAKTDAKLDRIGKQLGEIGHSNGDVAENYFFNSLEEEKSLGNIKFDYITKNIKTRKHRVEDEYDIFLENGNTVGIIEVKYNVKKEHINTLLEKKSKNFRILFPDYKDYNLYIGIAGLAVDKESEEYATENGLVVLKQQGDIMQVNSTGMRAF